MNFITSVACKICPKLCCCNLTHSTTLLIQYLQMSAAKTPAGPEAYTLLGLAASLVAARCVKPLTRESRVLLLYCYHEHSQSVQKQLAKKLGVTQVAVLMLENPKANPRQSNLK